MYYLNIIGDIILKLFKISARLTTVERSDTDIACV
jgi:hypothetical protein